MWYIDAWDVAGGLVFASERETEYAINIDYADETVAASVYMAAPAFEPMPTASRAIALSATRGAFQWGFFSPEGGEIAFNSLAELRETVRRAYIASAGPDSTPPLPEGSPPLVPLDGGGEVEELAAAVLDLISREFESEDERLSAGGGYREDLSRAVLSYCSYDHRNHVFYYCEKMLKLFIGGAISSRDAACDASVLVNILRSLLGREIWHVWGRRYDWPYWPVGWAVAPAPVSPDILFRLPLPQPITIGGRKVESMGDLLTAALADRTTFARQKRNADAHALMLPLLLAAVFASHLNPVGDGLMDDGLRFREALERGARWLARELPDYSLQPEVEATIEEMLGHTSVVSPVGAPYTATASTTQSTAVEPAVAQHRQHPLSR